MLYIKDNFLSISWLLATRLFIHPETKLPFSPWFCSGNSCWIHFLLWPLNLSKFSALQDTFPHFVGMVCISYPCVYDFALGHIKTHFIWMGANYQVIQTSLYSCLGHNIMYHSTIINNDFFFFYLTCNLLEGLNQVCDMGRFHLSKCGVLPVGRRNKQNYQMVGPPTPTANSFLFSTRHSQTLWLLWGIWKAQTPVVDWDPTVLCTFQEQNKKESFSPPTSYSPGCGQVGVSHKRPRKWEQTDYIWCAGEEWRGWKEMGNIIKTFLTRFTQ